MTLAASLTQPDWRYRFSYSQPTVTTDIGFEVNERLEMRVGPRYAGPACTVSGCATGGKVAVKATDIPASINLKDPIDDRPDSYLAAVLSGAGLELADVVKTTVFLADMADFQGMNQVYEKHFPSPAPARTTVAAAGLPRGARVEIEAVAVGRDL